MTLISLCFFLLHIPQKYNENNIVSPSRFLISPHINFTLHNEC